MLSISAPPTKMEKIINLIKRIDKPRKQIKITVVVSEVSTKELKKTGGQVFLNIGKRIIHL